MQVKDMMTSKPEYIDVNASIREVVIRMQEQDRGFTPVAEGDRIVGVVTDRDIAMRSMVDGKMPDDKINTVMSSKVLYCFENDDIKDVLQNMSQNKVQRLIVLNNEKNKDFAGVITLSDVAEHCKDGDLAQRVVNCCRHYH
ncbi:CBS domain-containing protein [Halopseudomonas pelagia]|uniref:CBS domain-containing protein n=1 Tax=Halopseudomonas pelagia TaxID=553151 RepID=A0AA91U026_9GAMM|nr:CBS domain-containing protein [Halopseudomonas pelagia]PCC98023.1 CBS domain-containing protein [Halopseudomonas pelagia]QFY55745.1 CBS domain-containing protein [Halopseudomonas pelagia]